MLPPNPAQNLGWWLQYVGFIVLAALLLVVIVRTPRKRMPVIFAAWWAALTTVTAVYGGWIDDWRFPAALTLVPVVGVLVWFKLWRIDGQ